MLGVDVWNIFDLFPTRLPFRTNSLLIEDVSNNGFRLTVAFTIVTVVVWITRSTSIWIF